jgi:hypothetical protein
MKKTNGSKLQGKNEGLPQLGQVYFYMSPAGARLVKIAAHLEAGAVTDILFTYEKDGYKGWSCCHDASKFHALRVVGSEELTRWAADVYGASPAQLN